MIRITIIGEPVPQGRPRFARRGNFVTTYDPPKSKAYKELVKQQARAQYKREPLTGALSLHLSIYRGVQKNLSKRKREAKLSGQIRPTKKPDTDNYFKGVTDPLTGILYTDDAMIVEETTEKYYSDNPRVEIELKKIGEADE